MFLRVYFDMHAFPSGVLNRVLSAAGLTIEHSNYQSRVVYHPLITDLEAGAAVTWAYKAYKVGSSHDGIVSLLPVNTPSLLKAFCRGWHRSALYPAPHHGAAVTISAAHISMHEPCQI